MRRNRKGSLLVVVSLVLIVTGTIAMAGLLRGQGGREHAERVARHLELQLALDAALVHGFHEVKAIDPSGSSASALSPGGEGELGGIPYRYLLRPLSGGGGVRIEGEAGPAGPGLPTSTGVALARAVPVGSVPGRGWRWSLRYLGAEASEARDH